MLKTAKFAASFLALCLFATPALAGIEEDMINEGATIYSNGSAFAALKPDGTVVTWG